MQRTLARMADRVSDWVGLVHALYPPGHAESWDSVGLQVGAPDWPVEHAFVALDVTSAVVAEAASGPASLIVAHHPLLFRPLHRLTPETATGRVALAAARAGVAVLAAHTNLDVASDGAGTSDPVATLLGLEDVAALVSGLRDDGNVKLVTFVPRSQTDAVLDALSATGAGVIGDYERCSFRVPGSGTFRPVGDANPSTGIVGQDNTEVEDRLEVVVPRARVAAAMQALRAAHPYEEVAVDLYPMVAGADVGLGRVGTLPEPRPLRAVAAAIRDGLPASNLRYAGNPDRLIRRVAVVGGAGDAHIADALGAGADVLVTGDLRHHVALDALELGLALIDAGHHATEFPAMTAWADRLRTAASQRGLTARLVPSSVPTDPWTG